MRQVSFLAHTRIVTLHSQYRRGASGRSPRQLERSIRLPCDENAETRLSAVRGYFHCRIGAPRARGRRHHYDETRATRRGQKIRPKAQGRATQVLLTILRTLDMPRCLIS